MFKNELQCRDRRETEHCNALHHGSAYDQGSSERQVPDLSVDRHYILYVYLDAKTPLLADLRWASYERHIRAAVALSKSSA